MNKSLLLIKKNKLLFSLLSFVNKKYNIFTSPSNYFRNKLIIIYYQNFSLKYYLVKYINNFNNYFLLYIPKTYK